MTFSMARTTALFIVIGPCSIHDIEAAKDYAVRLKQLAAEVSDTLYLVMASTSKSRVPPSAGKV
ncbi:hypothetical protein ULG90_05375 [Halopseudomonas pachastrellae]|nr:hypothetical protein ULG90_05375 [Halopseudomonas pachastrellae]